MRYLKVLGLVALFFFSMLFFVQNHEVLISVITLKLEVFGMAYQTEAVPFYLLVLTSFVLGAGLCIFYFFLERVRLAKQCKALKKERDALERELSTLRKPLDDYASSDSTENIQN